MPEFDANDDLTRLPGIRRHGRFARTVTARRRVVRLACRRPHIAGGPPSSRPLVPRRGVRRARCQIVRVRRPGPQS